ncbi:amidohydrolase family protein [Phenylobacterium sp.]|uniref:amidohydrolase family protein n=1 Tax=Phenylobacterium sp. TaxID=1871053 RepID=UPI001222D68C|nr:amidohydrolase family protein [Phenylobacterium sp.]THD65136.1 MAG: amidohydrolase [Phenylobacterium sp.]
MRPAAFAIVLSLTTALAVSGRGQPAAPTPGGEQGRYATFSLLHEIGSETYSASPAASGGSVTTIAATLSDRGSTRASTWTLKTGGGFAPTFLEEKRAGAAADEVWRTQIAADTVTVEEPGGRRTLAQPPLAYVGFPGMPAALQMAMMRYWLAHGEPAALPLLRASDQAPPLEIRRVGAESVTLPTGPAKLTRYTVANLLFGREVLWMDAQGRLAAVMTFAGGLPQEQVLEAYRPAFDHLVVSGVRQEMADLDELDRQVRPEATGAFAIVGARLIDGTGAPAVPDSVVIVRDGRIVAAGARATTPLPSGIKVIHAEGQSLLPGLWEMHSHYSGVEFGPALLAAGVTTARDCGGEFGFLTAVRAKIEREHALGPRLLLAGLIDAGGPLGFGAVDAETPAQGVAAVDRYADAGFNQIKVYTQLKPDVLTAISAEAHRRGITVTGHVPAAVDAFGGIADGMDQINHLQFVTRAMLPEGSNGPVDLSSDRAKHLITLMKERQIVVDPTEGWGEMAGHPKSVSAASFEPGLRAAPFVLASKFEALGGPVDEGRFRERMAANGRVIKALYDAGVPIVAGSDTGLIGYGVDRELELYVQAGLPPIAAIQTATLGAARAMKLDHESGSVEVGKRADLMLVNGDPLANISDLRRVTKVVRAGELYDSLALGRSVGFRRTN